MMNSDIEISKVGRLVGDWGWSLWNCKCASGVIRSHCMHRVQRCSLLLPIFRGLCVCLSVLDTTMSCAKRLNWLTCQCGLRTLLGPRNHVLGGAQIHFGEGAILVKTLCGAVFFVKILWPLVVVGVRTCFWTELISVQTSPAIKLWRRTCSWWSSALSCAFRSSSSANLAAPSRWQKQSLLTPCKARRLARRCFAH